ncbi:MAG: PTS sugar transporter subunit IIA [Candidatus Omnitrophica bacterium]|nr:PTS sugar transporter subunit IIA [Candidatus Omnitrophota bacterium]MBI3083689.1 PTS sugar transporter subunit IIA [Candidatus Omnitrophota bacterium]
MNIMSFLDDRAVSIGLKSQANKEEVIRELVELLVRAGAIKEKDVGKLVQTLLKRESLGSTGIGQGVAIPHGKSDCVTKLVAAFGVSSSGVNFDSLDGEPVHIFFLLIAPEDSAGPHLKALARISRLLKDKHFRDSLRAANDEKTLVKIIHEEDTRRH